MGLKNNIKKVKFGDHYVDCISRRQLVELCIEDIKSGSTDTKLVMDLNGHGLSLARKSKSYRDNVNQADIIHADGGFLVSLSKLKGGAVIPERSATTDMIHDFAASFNDNDYTFYLLGATVEVNDKCYQNLLSMYPNLRIVGRRHGYFSESDEDSIIADINRLKPNVVWLGLGKPKEQEIAVRWKQKLEVNWLITCGGCFNYISGHYSRSPKWMQEINLEWLYRMITSPRKLFWRYFITTPHALWIAVRTIR